MTRLHRIAELSARIEALTNAMRNRTLSSATLAHINLSIRQLTDELHAVLREG